MRVFISLNPDDSVKEKIKDIQNELKMMVRSGNRYFMKHIKWEEQVKFHMTLFFIGEISEDLFSGIDNGLSRVLNRPVFDKIKFEFTGIGAFPNLKYHRVLIAEFLNEDKKIFELSKRINELMSRSCLKIDRSFHPHITLGRVRRDRKINLKEIVKEIKSDINFTVEEICLMESKLKSSGSEYSVLKKYKI